MDFVYRNRVEEEQRRINRALKALSECKEAMIRAEDEAVLLNDICRIIVDVGGYRMAWIGYIEKDEVKTVRPVARAGYDEGYVDNLKIALNDPARGNGPTGISLKTGKPYGSRNVLLDEEMRPWREEALKRGYHSTLNLPLVYEKQVIGTLAIYSGEVDVFNEEEQELLFGLAQTLAYGITAMRDRVRRIQAEEELKRINDELETKIEVRTAKLRESEEKFRVLAETSPAAIFLYQGEKYIYVNPMAETLTGYSRDELLAGDAWDWIHPEFRELVKSRARKRQQGEQIPHRYEVMYRDRYGREGWVDFTASLIEYKGKPMGLAIAFDVSKRKQAEEALEESERRFRSIYEQAPMGIALMDSLTGRFVQINQRFCDIIGYSMDEMLATDFQSLTHPEDRQDSIDNVDRMLHGKIESYSMDKRYIHKNGSTVWVSLTVVPVWVDETSYKHHIAMVEDITGRKKIEESLVVAKSNAELYLDLMGHDINNINQIALGYMEMARDMQPVKDRLDFIDKSMEVLQRSTDLIGNVRKLQKLHEGALQARDVDVCRMLLDIQSEYGAIPGKVIVLNLNGQLKCLVHANELLHDVYANLVNNAVKHTRDGTTITINLDSGHYCRVAVEDNGPGIPDENKEKIFNRMHLGSARGMGLGLYLVRSLINSYGGRVWAEDRIKGDHTKGARFVVLLPAVEK